ncbi:hypothetical protein D0869_08196 [Hortaea werneckii]|uniref:SGNH hydrolase-type esterase domain-containing protein n=1 Tax=Hortaea werneckii TaxID=91943 RepID=A0A3M6YGQ8_HORWE|nr:hypothetical protein D0869_08196 [Hortaea werneckii]RMY02047.1 hypothetical protein D0868_08170 [Hortaea werneckii]
MRSGRNYPSQLAKSLKAELTDLTSSGATLLEVLEESQTTFCGEILSPQLSRLSSDTDIVTLTGGGNDLGYSKGMLYDAFLSFSGPMRNMARNLLSEPKTGISIDELVDRFTAVFDAVHHTAPKAKVYLVQYISIFGTDSRPGPGLPLTWEQIGFYRQMGVLLDRAYEKAAVLRADFVELVPVASFSEGHEVGSTEPWISEFTWKNGMIQFHPNVAGHTAIAEHLESMLQNEDRQSDH